MAIDPSTLAVGDYFLDDNEKIWKVIKAIPEATVEVERVDKPSETRVAGVSNPAFDQFIKLVLTP